MAFGALVPAFASLGLNFVIVKNIKERPSLTTNILSNTFLLRFITGVLISIFLMAIYYWLGANIESKFLVTASFIFASQVFLNSNVFVYFNEALLANRKTVINRNIALTLCTILRIWAIDTEQEIIIFAIINALEYGLFLALSFVTARKSVDVSQFRIHKKLSSILMREGAPLMMSAVVVMLYLRVDQMIIANLMNNTSVGIYSAASRITEMFYALPVLISNSFFPKIVEYQAKISKQKHILAVLYATTLLSTIFIALVITLFSKTIILSLYGESYLESSKVLAVYAWSLVFMGLLVSSSKYLLAIGRRDIIFKRDILGLGCNVLLNFWFIPKYGIIGAAWATLLSYSVSSYFSNLLFKGLRTMMKQQLTSCFVVIGLMKNETIKE